MISKKQSTLIWVAIVLQLLTSFFHSLSFFSKETPKNQTERQLMDLANNYKPDAGLGFHPSLMNLFIGLSICYTLINLFGAVLNIYSLRKKVEISFFRGLLNIQILFFAAVFVAMLCFTFFPPILCSGLICFALILARISFNK